MAFSRNFYTILYSYGFPTCLHLVIFESEQVKVQRKLYYIVTFSEFLSAYIVAIIKDLNIARRVSQVLQNHTSSLFGAPSVAKNKP